MKRFIQGTAFFVLAAVLLLWPKSLFAQDAAVEIFLGVDYIEPGQEINLSPDGETADYIYDGNGNMTYDALRHIAMTYDINNLVSTVSRNDTLLSTYTYLADGTKYKVLDTVGNGRSYIGPFCMAIEKTGTGASAQTKAYLESIDADSGRILAIREQTGSGANILTNTAYTTAFFTKDHLGSVRAVTDAQGNILERNAYYPFGLQNNQNLAFPTIPTSLSTLYPNSISSVTARQDLYNGKEIQTTAGTDFIDYGFRQYDPITARWMAVDPKAEKKTSITLYNYCIGNPILLLDYQGLFDLKTGTIEKGDCLINITKTINRHFGTNLTLDEIAKANNIEDINKIFIGNKIVLPGENIELVFNLDVLKVRDITYGIDIPGLCWKGTSGRKGFQSPEYQSLKDMGPIPEGEYIVDPANTQAYSDISTCNKYRCALGLGSWPGGQKSWGNYRTWLVPKEGTNTYGRGNFSIHGGAEPGSSGCIDLTADNDKFHSWLKRQNRVIILRVVYS